MADKASRPVPPSVAASKHAKSASTDASFLPRSEFWKATVTPHAFALISFNGNEILRLANCPDNVVAAVRRVIPPDDIRHFREDPHIVVCEFLLAGRPFSGRSVKQEKLLIDIFTAIMSEGYTLVTSIDYGRIYLDKLTLAFKREVVPASDQPKPKLDRTEAFGISFMSSTALRVVVPPLRLTPAILQVVRSAWPHGVVGEKRESDGSYLFKLKGYSFFKQSTFETDSLAHTLQLLKGMDSHGFTLVTSLSLAKRSRVQDFWIFSAPAPPLPPTLPSVLNGLPTLKPFAGSEGTGKANGSPVQSHSMLGLSNTGPPPAVPSNIQRVPVPYQSLPSAPAVPTSQSHPAVQALASSSGHQRSSSLPGQPPLSRAVGGPVAGGVTVERSASSAGSYIRHSSIPGTQHVLRKTPPTSRNTTASPANQLHPSNPQLLVTGPGSGQMPAQRDADESRRFGPGLPYPVSHQPTSSSSGQLLYTSGPPPRSGPEPVYHTVPSAAFALPPNAYAAGSSRGMKQPSPLARNETLPHEQDFEDGDEDDDEDEHHMDDPDATPALLASGVFRDTVGTSAFGEGWGYETDDDDRDRSGDYARVQAAAAYLGSVGIADFAGADENATRRAGFEESEGSSDTTRDTMMNIHDQDAEQTTPRVVHQALLPENDPSRRISDQGVFDQVPPRSILLPPHGGESTFAPQRPQHPASLVRPMSDETHYLPGAWVSRANSHIPPGSPGHDYGPPEDLDMTPREELNLEHLPSSVSSTSVPLEAATERATTAAAAAEVVAHSNSAKKHQEEVAAGETDPSAPPRELKTMQPVATSGTREDSEEITETAVENPTPEPPVTMRASEGESKSGSGSSGPWVLVEDLAPTTGGAITESPTTRLAPNQSESAKEGHTATGVASPSGGSKTRKGAFPWSKSRREQREKERTLEKEKAKGKGKSTGGSNIKSLAPDVPASTAADPSNEPPVTDGAPKGTTPLSPPPPVLPELNLPGNDSGSLSVEHGDPHTNRSSGSSATPSGSTNSSGSSSSSPLPTPNAPSSSLATSPPVPDSNAPQTDSSFAKGFVGRLRGKPPPIPPVGTAEKRLTID